MALYYHYADHLEALFGQLYALLKAERKALTPQAPQTIIVGNLDTENFVRSSFLARDGVLMGVEFPFLENALDNFYRRQVGRIMPQPTQGWFSAPEKSDSDVKPGILELELLLLGLMASEQESSLFSDLGYDVAALGEIQRLAVAQNLALRLREYLLHLPDTMREYREGDGKKTVPAIAKLWRRAAAAAKKKFAHSILFWPESFANALKAAGKPPRLYLFGMPLLSAWHVQVLAHLATIADIHLLAVEWQDGRPEKIGLKFAAYRRVLEDYCARAGAILEINRHEAVAHSARVEFWSLPGSWRAAEILADRWHASLISDPGLRQDELSCLLTEPQRDFIAFETACAMRELTASTRGNFLEGLRPLVDLVSILGEAAAGANRDLVLRFWENAAVRRAFAIDDSTRQTFVEALSRSAGYRNDYPEAQGVYNIDAALCRMARALILDETAHLPAVQMRQLENPETWQAFIASLRFLLKAPRRLALLQGEKLITAMVAALAAAGFETDEDFSFLTTFLQRVAGQSGAGFPTFAQLVRLLRAHAGKTAIHTARSREGISFSTLSQACPATKQVVFYNLDEDTDAADQADRLLPAYDSAPTRLDGSERILFALESARRSGATEIVCAWSNVKPDTGAEKYPSVVLSGYQNFLEKKGIPVTVREDFAVAVPVIPGKDEPPLASIEDHSTVAILRDGKHRPLAAELLSRRPGMPQRKNWTVKELETFLVQPTVALLQNRAPESAEFKHQEPRLSTGDSARFKFAEDYLLGAVKDRSSAEIKPPSRFVRDRQATGFMAPDGFENAAYLLSSNDNDAALRRQAEAERAHTRWVEIFLYEGSKPFTVEEAPRLERRYLPAPVIASLPVTGLLTKFCIRTGEDGGFILGSAVYPERSALLVKMHLWLCLGIAAHAGQLIPEQLSLLNYTFPDRHTKKGILEPEISRKGFIARDEIRDPAQYLEALGDDLKAATPFWFDLSAFGKTKLASLADLTETEVQEKMADSTTIEEKADATRRFYNLQASDMTSAFFAKFIKPVAQIDAAHDAAEKIAKGKKRG